MEPAIPAGSRLRIMCLAPQFYRTGQVIAFVAGDGVCVHRIVYRGRWRHARNYLITMGDNCQMPDAPVHVDSILGTVTEFAHEGPWKPPPRAPRLGRPLGRLVRLLVRLILAGILELNLQLAEWLTQKLWGAAATFNQARARFLLAGKRNTSRSR